MSRFSFSRVTKRRVFGLLGAGLLLGSLAACSHTPFQHHRGDMASMTDEDAAQMRARFVERASKHLNLDEAQKARLGVLADAMNAQRKTMMGAGQGPNAASPRAAMTALVQGDKFDRTQAQALIEAKTGAVRMGSPAVIAAAGDFFDSLKPEQQQKVREMLARGGHHGHGFGHG